MKSNPAARLRSWLAIICIALLIGCGRPKNKAQHTGPTDVDRIRAVFEIALKEMAKEGDFKKCNCEIRMKHSDKDEYWSVMFMDQPYGPGLDTTVFVSDKDNHTYLLPGF